MKKASNIRLSLRKLLLATLAVGPIAVLPSPVYAALPVSSDYTVTNGSVSLASAGTTATLTQTSSNAILVWGAGKFNIATGDTWNFQVPSGGAVLNKVGYLTTGALGSTDTAKITGTLYSNGKVFVLANGAIEVDNGATISTTGGAYLSTISETSDFNFLNMGSLAGTGSSTGSVTIGTASGGINVSGNLDVHAGAIVSHGAAVSGDLVYRAITSGSGSAIELNKSANLTVGGNLSVTTNNGAITNNTTNLITAGLTVSGNQTTTLSTGSSGNAAITLDGTTNDFEIVAITAPGTNGNVTLADANIITLGASTIGGSANVTVAGAADTNGIRTNGTVAITGDAYFKTNTNNSGVNIGNNSTIAGYLTGNTTNSSFTINTLGDIKIGTAGIDASAGNKAGVSITTAGNLTIGNSITTAGNGTTNATAAGEGGNISLKGAVVNATGSTITLDKSIKGNVSFESTSGALTLGTVNGPKVFGKTAGGAITQGAAITTYNGTTASSFDAGTGTITLTHTDNVFASGQQVRLKGSAASVTSKTNKFTLGNTTVTGAVNITSTNTEVQLGTGAGTDAEPINIGGLLTISTGGGAISDANYGAITVTGGLNLTTGGGTVTLDAARANGTLSPLVQTGGVTINSGTGAIDIAETSTLNLVGITTSGGLIARSVSGGIIDTGVINAGSSAVEFNVTSTSEAIVLDNTGHSFGALTVKGGNGNSSILVGSGGATLTSTSNTTGLTLASSSAGLITLGDGGGTASVGNLTVNSNGKIEVAGAVSATNLTLNAEDASATSITDSSGPLTVTGTATLSSKGNIVLDNTSTAAHDFNTLVFNGVVGDALVNDANAVTVSGTGTAKLEVQAGKGATAAAWPLTLGNITAGSLVMRANDGGGGNSGTITQQSGTTISSFGATSFQTDNANIVVNNSGNNFGRLSATAGNGGITLRETGTIRLGAISNNGTNTTITSDTGSIQEDDSVGATATSYTTTNATITFSAAAGNILLANSTIPSGGNPTVGASTSITATAAGNAKLFSSAANVSLGRINANTFSVNHTGTGNLTQSSRITTYGAAEFTSSGNMIISNTTNNFGRVSITLNGAGKNATLTEENTLNLGTVSQPGAATGNVTLTSSIGDIIDTGLAGVKLGGTVASNGSGVVTLSAVNGNILLDDPTTEFVTSGGIVFNGGNVTLSGLGQGPGTIWLGASGVTSTAGNLTVTSAVGSIGNTGALNVTGTASFTAAAGNIGVSNTANQFGALRFVGNQVSISQTNSMNIQTGSSAIGAAVLSSSGGNVTIVNAGGAAVSFGSTATLNAAGTIILPKLVQAVGNITVNASGTKDLSALSKAGDLGGKDPINSGTGSYVAPQP